ncbi:mitochondrial carrier domain-containing protein [Lipomyces tetrasporus]|uniref:Mitochondrial carrier domain-containing protein n=1 Tax=Lipomyces tetrasporus TaxID=54092 RepID=A0AAD7QVB9_9ASCO|nr:mitochondrial carrier domain-containing protein [Lipomyces tetrasporus]KAJ8101988.1 mitochondrial carrier domain-containing protein [Lipomyces tetrasporus]
MPQKRKTAPAVNLIAGGTAGLCEALCCHPLDTIKVRMQLSTRSSRAEGVRKLGFFATGVNIARKESIFGLYKGLGAVITGIVPKMAIRFSSFEFFKTALADKTTQKTSSSGIFFAGLAAGTTEAVLVVNPTDVIKIRLQAQHHSMADPLDVPKYRNAAHAAFTIVREEGLSTLYRGVVLTALRQATNQAVNFSAYTEIKAYLKTVQSQYHDELPSYQHMVIGLISGALGPLSNAPIDTIKTRMQKETAIEGESALARVSRISRNLVQREGFSAFYKGITPRVMRVAPGQAVTFAVYEQASKFLEQVPLLNGQSVLTAED